MLRFQSTMLQERMEDKLQTYGEVLHLHRRTVDVHQLITVIYLPRVLESFYFSNIPFSLALFMPEASLVVGMSLNKPAADNTPKDIMKVCIRGQVHVTHKTSGRKKIIHTYIIQILNSKISVCLSLLILPHTSLLYMIVLYTTRTHFQNKCKWISHLNSLPSGKHRF